MKTKKYSTYLLCIFAIILIGIKLLKLNDFSKPTVGQDDGKLNNSVTSRGEISQQNDKVISTPAGKLTYAEYLPKHDIFSILNQEDWIEEMQVEKIKRMEPLPWQVYLDEQQCAVKMLAGVAGEPVVSYDDTALAYMEKNHGCHVVGIDKKMINLNDKNLLKELAHFLEKTHMLENATQRDSETSNMAGVQFYPVTVIYSTPQGYTDNRNQDYFGGKELPMMLIKTNIGSARQEANHAEEWNVIYEKYNLEECRMIMWELLPFARNQKEAEWFKNAPDPHSVGASFLYPAPFVSAWEKVHGKKYVEGK